MFCHPAWAAFSYSSGPPDAIIVGTQSTGGLYCSEVSPCILPGKVTVDEGLGEYLALGDVVELLLQDVLLDLLKVLDVLVVGQLQGDHSYVTYT